MNVKPPILDHAATLADVTRCRVLQVLERHELTVSELCQILQLPQSTVSRHLKVLADGGWLSSHREGTSNLYRMANGNLDEAAAELWQLVRRETSETALPSRRSWARSSSVSRSPESNEKASRVPPVTGLVCTVALSNSPPSGTSCATSFSARASTCWLSPGSPTPSGRWVTWAAAPGA